MALRFPNLFLMYLFIFAVTVSIVFIAFIDIDGMWNHLLVHSAIESSGATLAIILALMLLMVDTFHSEGKYILFGLAFLSMGILDGIHSVLSPNHAFVFYHSIASLVGASFLVLIWFKSLENILLQYRIYLVFFTLVALLSSSFFFFDGHSHIPQMLNEKKHFTGEAVFLNVLAGVFFLLASIKLLMNYIKYEQADDFIFFTLSLFFGVAEMLFNFSTLWEYEWWLWHFIRFFAYILILYFIAMEIKKQKELLDYQAHHDALTGLPNRVLFDDRLRQTIEKTKRNKGKFALLFLDLDHFKDINDTHGHHIGDDILRVTSTKLEHVVRHEDTICRLGGDEFTIIMEGLSDSADASVLAQKILNEFSTPTVINEFTFYLSTSMGISVYPDNGETAEDLLKFSDIAMYKSKEHGRNNFQFYTSNLTDLTMKRVEIENDLRRAIDDNEFEVYYQPQYNALTDTMIGSEALVRWIHPKKGLIPAYEFISIAEKTGILLELDKFVMTTAMRQFSSWYHNGYEPGVLSLNLSIKQLEKKECFLYISNLLKETKCKAEWLEFEITESEIMKNPEKSIEKLTSLTNMNIKLSVDDFGTGYSSLVYLKKLPIHKLKIDREFVKGIPDDKDDEAIIKTIISLAENLNLETIAEGVETKEQKEFLVSHGCVNIQGYLYARPMSNQDLKKLL